MTLRLGAGVLTAALCVATLACDDAPPSAPPPAPLPAWTPELTSQAERHSERLDAVEPVPDGGLRVHLAFGAEGDLDLYVTGPDQETIYYANTPGKRGGTLVADRRCNRDEPRTETVRFAEPLVAGRYRVGVDYPHACGDDTAPAPFVVQVDGPNGRAQHRGLARYHVFEPVVIEFDLADRTDPPAEVKP